MGRNTAFSLTVLGARGSMAVCGKDTSLFGGSTSCYMVQAGQQTLFLDAGSGLLSAPVDFDVPPVILLSHLHLDHVLGLGMYARLSQKGKKTNIFLPAGDEQSAEELLNRLYEPPYWPLHLEDYAGDVDIQALQLPMQIGEVTVEGMPGSHPGGCMVFKISHEGRSLVYATDFEHGTEASARLAAFAKDADLLLYDAQYTPASYEACRGFGHSTAEEGIALMAACDAKRLLLVHHDPKSTDAQLSEREEAIGRADVRFAREGEVFVL